MNKLITFGVFLFLLLSVGYCTTDYDRIESTSTGLRVSRFGDNKGAKGIEPVSGGVISFPAWNYEVYSVENIIREGTYKNLTVTSKDRLGVTVGFTATYQIEPHNSIPVFVKYRRYINKEKGTLELNPVVSKFVFQAASDVAGKFGAEEIVIRKTEYYAEVAALAKKRLDLEGIKADQILPAIDPILPDGIRASILNKVQAESDAQTEVSKWRMKRAKASGDSIEAVGAARVKLLEADAEAQSIRKITAALNKDYNEYIKIQRWNGANPNVMSGSGSGMMINVK